MSRVGKLKIEIPKGVEVKKEDKKITVKGPKGELFYEIRPEIEASIEGSQINVSPKIETKKTKAYWGLTRSLLANMVKGVSEGFEKKLEVRGVGYKVSVEGDNLALKVGFSHPVNIKKPEGIDFSVSKNIITVSGINKQLVGQTAARIKKVRPPDVYKGKGIRYLGEQVRKKEGKKAATAAA